MRESFKPPQRREHNDIPRTQERTLSPSEYDAQIPDMLVKEKQFGHGLGAYGRRVLVGLLAMTAFAIGEGAMREARGQVGQKSGSAVEDVFNRYSGEVKKVGERANREVEDVSNQYSGDVQRVGQKYRDAGGQAEEEVRKVGEKANREVDQYRQQREITVDRPDAHVQIRRGYGGKKSTPQMSEQDRIKSYEQIDELAMQALRILYDIPNRNQAKFLIKDFADQIHADVGDAAEILSGNIERLINQLNNQPDNTFDSKAFAAFMRSIKNHPGIQEVLDSARFHTAPRPKGAPPR